MGNLTQVHVFLYLKSSFLSLTGYFHSADAKQCVISNLSQFINIKRLLGAQ